MNKYILNRKNYYKNNEKYNIDIYYKKSSRNNIICRIVLALMGLVLSGTFVWSLANLASITLSDIDHYQFILYTTIISIYVVPIYIYIVLSLSLTLIFLWSFRKILPYKDNWSHHVLSNLINHIGVGTSLGFLFGVLTILANLSNSKIFNKLDIITVVTGTSVAGTFFAIPISLILALVKSGKNLHIPAFNIILVPVAYSISWNVPNFFTRNNVLHEMQIQSLKYYIPPYADELIKINHLENHLGIQEVIINEINANTNISTDYSIWFWGILFLIIFFIVCSIILDEIPKWGICDAETVKNIPEMLACKICNFIECDSEKPGEFNNSSASKECDYDLYDFH